MPDEPFEPATDAIDPPPASAPGESRDESDHPDEAAVLRAENQALASRLRDALLAADSAIAPEMVSGETVAEIEASYAAAKALADRVRESVRRESQAASSVPAGAPGRSQARPLNPRAKIRAGLSRPAGSLEPAP